MTSKRHVTATDKADADAILDVLEGHVYGASIEDGAREIAKVAIAKLLADKREEWIACAMVRVEREFKVTRRKDERFRENRKEG